MSLPYNDANALKKCVLSGVLQQDNSGQTNPDISKYTANIQSRDSYHKEWLEAFIVLSHVQRNLIVKTIDYLNQLTKKENNPRFKLLDHLQTFDFDAQQVVKAMQLNIQITDNIKYVSISCSESEDELSEVMEKLPGCLNDIPEMRTYIQHTEQANVLIDSILDDKSYPEVVIRGKAFKDALVYAEYIKLKVEEYLRDEEFLFFQPC